MDDWMKYKLAWPRLQKIQNLICRHPLGGVSICIIYEESKLFFMAGQNMVEFSPLHIDAPRRRHSNFSNWIYASSCSNRARTKTQCRFVNPNTLICQYLNGSCSRKLEIECVLCMWRGGVCKSPLQPHRFRVQAIRFVATKNRRLPVKIRQMCMFLFLFCIFAVSTCLFCFFHLFCNSFARKGRWRFCCVSGADGLERNSWPLLKVRCCAKKCSRLL